MGDDEREAVIKLTAGLDRRALACCTFSGEGGSELNDHRLKPVGLEATESCAQAEASFS